MAKVITQINGKTVMVDSKIFLDAAATAEAVEGEQSAAPSPPAQDDASGQEAAPPPESQLPSQRTTSVKPEEVPWDEWHRRTQAVRAAAREFDDMDHGDIREYLKGKVKRELSDEEVGQFKHDVQAHRVEDVTDILDNQLRTTVDQMKRARRTVRVSAPRGWMRRAFNQLDERAVEQVCVRLISRGHDTDTIKNKVVSRVTDEEARQRITDRLEGKKIQIEFSDDVYGDGSLDSPSMTVSGGETLSPKETMQFALEMAKEISANVKVPNVEIEVNSGGSSKKVIRGEDGLVKEIVEE